MDIRYDYTSDIMSIITGSLDDREDFLYTLPEFDETHIIKLSVYSRGTYIDSYELTKDEDYYVNNGSIIFKPNDKLDSAQLVEGNYELQYDFIQKVSTENLYIDEISSTRTEIRLKSKNDGDNQNFISSSFERLTNSENLYTFEGNLELPNNQYIPINSFVEDRVTYEEPTLIFKLNNPLPNEIGRLYQSFEVVRKFIPTQRNEIFFKDIEGLAIQAKALAVDVSTSADNNLDEDTYESFNTITGSLSERIFDEFKRDKKDLNLNIDFTEFKNHTHFGSAVSKLENFKDKVVTLEGYYNSINNSLSYSSSFDVKEKRKKIFKKIEEVKDTFTLYEKFLYNDGQSYSTSSAPSLGKNLAGGQFNNNHGFIESFQDFDGFDRVTHFTSSNDELHMFTGIYDVAQPPFYNTNDWVYLSFILSGDRQSDTTYNITTENSSSNPIYRDESLDGFKYNKSVNVPKEAASGSSLLNPTATGSEYKRYIVRAQQNYWRPLNTLGVGGEIILINDWVGGLNDDYEILSGSNYISASTSGSIGDGFAYGIKDASGYHTPSFFPTIVDEKGLVNRGYVTASVLPQGDLFPIRIKSNGNYETYVSDVRVSLKDPTNTHPFSPMYRPPSGSYGGSSEWNGWYDGMLSSASLYDTQNIHSLVNNIPEFLREDNQHKVLRDFINMISEEYDLLRNYIDNYLNITKLGYKNPNSIPDNLLPIVADSAGYELLSSLSSSLSDYIDSNKTEEIGTKDAINATWKKILNNLIYIYKTKGSVESIKALLNIHGFNSDAFNLREYGGSITEHNPTIITNDSQGLLDGLKNTSGSISFIENITPFLMLNVSSASNGHNRFGVDWFANSAEPNGLELVFNAEEPTSNVTQSLMRLSGSNNDLWNINLIPEHNTSTTKGKIQFRLNRTANGSGTTHFSMETPLIDNLFGDNIYNLILQRNSGSDFEDGFPLSQSYQMFVGRKNNDAIVDYHIVSMSISSSIGDGISKLMAKRANRNFRNSGSIASDGARIQNLLIGETVTGSIAEVRAWSAYLSSSKFKQHILNYESTVGGTITSSFSDIIYRYRLNEGYVNSDTNPDLASLNINDSNPNNVKNFTHLLTTQDKLNYRTVTTEQIFYSFGVRGRDDIQNDNTSNLYPELSSEANLNPNFESLTEPYNPTPGRFFSNNFGSSLSYVNAVDSLIFNIIPDFSIENEIGDYNSTLSDGYEDLKDLRKNLITNAEITVDVGKNQKSIENFISTLDEGQMSDLLPARTQLNFSYDVRNDVLFRSRIKNAKLTTELNANNVVGSSSLAEPTISTFVNDTVKDGNINVLTNELTLSSSKIDSYSYSYFDQRVAGFNPNGEVKSTNIYNVSSENLTIRGGEISGTNLYNLSSENLTIRSNAVSLNTVDLTNSINQSVYTLEPSDFKNIMLGSKNEFYKNHGKEPDKTWFKSANPGSGSTFNTYHYEDRFTFPTIGDTELYIPITASYTAGVRQKTNKHDEFEDFFNRQFIDAGNGYTYSTLHQPNPTIDGRMVGRTSYFSSSEGNIHYPSNHYLIARTSKDVLDNLIYKGTQHDGSNPTLDPTNTAPDVYHTQSAYTITSTGGNQLQLT
tara:strand:- start:4304 stop:9064 length:4761 start_codon:yes stop_codon:yes gene_type:complete